MKGISRKQTRCEPPQAPAHVASGRASAHKECGAKCRKAQVGPRDQPTKVSKNKNPHTEVVKADRKPAVNVDQQERNPKLLHYRDFAGCYVEQFGLEEQVAGFTDVVKEGTEIRKIGKLMLLDPHCDVDKITYHTKYNPSEPYQEPFKIEPVAIPGLTIEDCKLPHPTLFCPRLPVPGNVTGECTEFAWTVAQPYNAHLHTSLLKRYMCQLIHYLELNTVAGVNQDWLSHVVPGKVPIVVYAFSTPAMLEQFSDVVRLGVPILAVVQHYNEGTHFGEEYSYTCKSGRVMGISQGRDGAWIDCNLPENWMKKSGKIEGDYYIDTLITYGPQRLIYISKNVAPEEPLPDNLVGDIVYEGAHYKSFEYLPHEIRGKRGLKLELMNVVTKKEEIKDEDRQDVLKASGIGIVKPHYREVFGLLLLLCLINTPLNWLAVTVYSLGVWITKVCLPETYNSMVKLIDKYFRFVMYSAFKAFIAFVVMLTTFLVPEQRLCFSVVGCASHFALSLAFKGWKKMLVEVVIRITLNCVYSCATWRIYYFLKLVEFAVCCYLHYGELLRDALDLYCAPPHLDLRHGRVVRLFEQHATKFKDYVGDTCYGSDGLPLGFYYVDDYNVIRLPQEHNMVNYTNMFSIVEGYNKSKGHQPQTAAVKFNSLFGHTNIRVDNSAVGIIDDGLQSKIKTVTTVVDYHLGEIASKNYGVLHLVSDDDFRMFGMAEPDMQSIRGTITNRLLQTIPECQITEGDFFTMIRKFWRDNGKRQYEADELDEIPDLSNYRGMKRMKYIRAMEGMDNVKPFYQCFLKNEMLPLENLHKKPTRLITPNTAVFNVVNLNFFHKFEHDLLSIERHGARVFAKGCTYDERLAILNVRRKQYKYVCPIDFKNFDAHHRYTSYLAELDFYAWLGLDADTVTRLKTAKRGGMLDCLFPSRASGDLFTGSGNCLVVASMLNGFSDRLEITCDGDDTLLWFNETSVYAEVERRLYDLGFEISSDGIQNTDSQLVLQFCQMTYDLDNGVYWFDLNRRMNKLLNISFASGSDPTDTIIGKIQGLVQLRQFGITFPELRMIAQCNIDDKDLVDEETYYKVVAAEGSENYALGHHHSLHLTGLLGKICQKVNEQLIHGQVRKVRPTKLATRAVQATEHEKVHALEVLQLLREVVRKEIQDLLHSKDESYGSLLTIQVQELRGLSQEVSRFGLTQLLDCTNTTSSTILGSSSKPLIALSPLEHAMLRTTPTLIRKLNTKMYLSCNLNLEPSDSKSPSPSQSPSQPQPLPEHPQRNQQKEREVTASTLDTKLTRPPQECSTCTSSTQSHSSLHKSMEEQQLQRQEHIRSMEQLETAIKEPQYSGQQVQKYLDQLETILTQVYPSILEKRSLLMSLKALSIQLLKPQETMVKLEQPEYLSQFTALKLKSGNGNQMKQMEILWQLMRSIYSTTTQTGQTVLRCTNMLNPQQSVPNVITTMVNSVMKLSTYLHSQKLVSNMLDLFILCYRTTVIVLYTQDSASVLDPATMEECAVRMSMSAIEILTGEFEKHANDRLEAHEHIANILLADKYNKRALERSTPIGSEHASFLEEHLHNVFGENVLPLSHVLTKLFLERYVAFARVFAH
nr:MAG: RNA-dependent RNA polymerase [Statovirus sp.]